jgi:hypothetical protein
MDTRDGGKKWNVSFPLVALSELLSAIPHPSVAFGVSVTYDPNKRPYSLHVFFVCVIATVVKGWTLITRSAEIYERH